MYCRISEKMTRLREIFQSLLAAWPLETAVEPGVVGVNISPSLGVCPVFEETSLWLQSGHFSHSLGLLNSPWKSDR